MTNDYKYVNLLTSSLVCLHVEGSLTPLLLVVVRLCLVLLMSRMNWDMRQRVSPLTLWDVLFDSHRQPGWLEMFFPSTWVNPCTHTVAIKHPVTDWVKLSFVILISGHCDAPVWASECPDVKNYKWRCNPVWHKMLYSCTHMATVGVRGLMHATCAL